MKIKTLSVHLVILVAILILAIQAHADDTVDSSGISNRALEFGMNGLFNLNSFKATSLALASCS